MEDASTSETSVNFYQTTRRNIPEDSHLHTRSWENLKSHVMFVIYIVWTGKDFQGKGDSYFKVLSQISQGEFKGKLRQTTSRITGYPVDIRTVNLPTFIAQCCRYTSLSSVFIIYVF
jgi:hypothetical protein